MQHPKEINITDFDYDLPEERIALHPLEVRDTSKLLVFDNQKIVDGKYRNIAQHIPTDSLVFFNNTKVIKARLFFKKPTGSVIEIFLLEPYQSEYTTALSSNYQCQWKCLVGGASKWKEPNIFLQLPNTNISASRIEKLDDAYAISFTWDSGESFADILEAAGNIPLPPYLNRLSEKEDEERYQTVYAQHNGSVAAPTAGLHFTDRIFEDLQSRDCSLQYLTLHVGAGTFKPVKTDKLQEHVMHAEWIDVKIETIRNLAANVDQAIVAVGTTSVRTLESLYWLGVKAHLKPEAKTLSIAQWDVYDSALSNITISATAALAVLISWLEKNNLNSLITATQIIIAPSYKYKIVNKIVTNFHQPKSTLLLLVAAAVGDWWKDIYNHALANDYRFLSYGDGSIISIAE